MHTMDDVRRIAKEEGFHEDMLLVIYTHRVTRNATKNFYKVKAKIPRLLQEWERGTSLFELASQFEFPPVLMSYLVLMEKGIGRKQFWKYVRDPNCIQNKRIKKEILEVVDKDYIYGPAGTDIQVKRGKDGEATMAIILDHYNIQYLVEKELRGVSTKTPDFLLHKPLMVDGKVINWIESKANFGDLVEVRRNYTKQLSAYVKLFGPGMVVYWFGYVDDAPQAPEIIMADGQFVEDLFDQSNWGKRVMPVEGGESPTKRFRKKGGETGVANTTLEDFETGFGASVVEDADQLDDKETVKEQRSAQEAVHAYTHAHEQRKGQAHGHSQERHHVEGPPQSYSQQQDRSPRPQQPQHSPNRSQDRFGRGKRRGGDRGRGRGRGGDRRNEHPREREQAQSQQTHQQRNQPKKSKEDDHDWTLDLM